MSKRVLIVLGHPSKDSLCHAIADAYADGAQRAGHEVRRLNLCDLAFDPILHEGYNRIQDLEPDLVRAQADITWAQHVVWVYPIWWGAMPALLKGFLDRAFLPGFAFKYRQGSSLWDRLLAGRSAHVISTMDSPPWYFRWFSRMPGHQQMKRTILGFCGFDPIQVTSFGPVRGSTPERRAQWLARAQAFGQRA